MDVFAFIVATTAVRVAEIQVVEPFLACAQYVVVLEILGVVKLFPVPNDVPPVDAAYQSTTEPAFADVPSVTVPVPQRDAGVVVEIVGNALLVNKTWSDTEHAPLTVVNCNVTELPAVIPVTKDAVELGVVMLAVPLITDQFTLPPPITVPFNVKFPFPH